MFPNISHISVTEMISFVCLIGILWLGQAQGDGYIVQRLFSAKNDKTDVKNSFKTFDFGVNFGLGYKLDNGLNFGARYNLGLTDINNLDNPSSKYKNGVFQISVGYFFF